MGLELPGPNNTLQAAYNTLVVSIEFRARRPKGYKITTALVGDDSKLDESADALQCYQIDADRLGERAVGEGLWARGAVGARRCGDWQAMERDGLWVRGGLCREGQWRDGLWRERGVRGCVCGERGTVERCGWGVGRGCGGGL